MDETKAIKLGVKVTFGVIGLIALLWFVFQIVDSVPADRRVVLQTVTGNLKIQGEPGPYIQFFGTPHEYSKVIAVNFTGKSNAQASSVIPRIKVRFLDTSLGEARGVARFRLPTDEKSLLKIQTEFGSQEAMISNLLERVVERTAKASARVMTVEAHYSGGQGQMTMDFRDQLDNGTYVIEQFTERVKPLKQSMKARKGLAAGDELKSRSRVSVRKKRDQKGNFIRNSNPLSAYNITVVSASIEDVDYEDRVDQRLAAQKQAAADEALARQNLKKAEQEALTARALGDKAIAEQKARSMKEKLKATIDADREKAVAEIQAKQRVEIARQKALEQGQELVRQKKEAEGLRVMALARKQAKENALDPKFVFETKLKTFQSIEIAKYQYMSKSQLVPTVVMGNSKGGGSNALDYLNLLGIKAAKDLGVSLNTRK